MNNFYLESTTVTRGARRSRNKSTGSRWKGIGQLSRSRFKDSETSNTLVKKLADGTELELSQSIIKDDSLKSQKNMPKAYEADESKIEKEFLQVEFKVPKGKVSDYRKILKSFSAKNNVLYLLAPVNDTTDASFIFGVIGIEGEVFDYIKVGITDGKFLSIKRSDVFKDIKPLDAGDIEEIKKSPNKETFNKWLDKGLNGWLIYKAELTRLRVYAPDETSDNQKQKQENKNQNEPELAEA